jgi:hypothetical protein
MLSSRLMSEVRNCTVAAVPTYSFPWADRTPLQHWATVSYVIYMQGKQPTRVLVDEGWRDALLSPSPEIHYCFFHKVSVTPGPSGWYDYSKLIESLKAEDRP